MNDIPDCLFEAAPRDHSLADRCVDAGIWRDLFDCSPIALSHVDLTGNQIAINQAFADLLGYQKHELMALRVVDLVKENEREWTSGYYARLTSGELDHFSTDKVLVCKDGAQITVTCRLRSVRTRGGICTGLLGAFYPAEVRGRVDDQRLDRLLSFSEATVTLVDENGLVLEATGRYQAVLGYPPEFWENRTIFDLLAPGQELIALEFRDEVLAHPGHRCSTELQLLSATGETHDIRLHALNLLADPNVNGVVLTTVNITEELQMFEGLHQRTTTAEAVLKAQTLLLATVSHELRNPLHALEGIAELLKHEPLSTRAATLASELHAQLTGLADIAQDLLDAAQASAGTVRVRPARVALHFLIFEVARYGEALVTKLGSHVDIRCTIEPNVPALVVSDAVRLRQILRNLVGNAIKFTPQGTVELHVSSDVAGIVRFSVSDSGEGIPAADLDRIREPFVTGALAGVHGGAGLGLSIVTRTVAAMNGSMQISSAVGVGSKFSVDLPLESVAVEPQSKGEDVTAPRQSAAEFDPTGTVVLVVDDNAVNRQLARGQLSRIGMESHIVGSGEEAIELLRYPHCPRFDVVLMDHGMPGMNGVETMLAIRALGGWIAAVPVICLTASAAVADQHRFLSEGMDGFISKPASLAVLRAGIISVLTAKPCVEPILVPSDPPTRGAASTNQSSSRSHVFSTLSALSDDLGDLALVRELTLTFIREMPERVRAFNRSNPSGNASAAHTLRSSSRLLGVSELADLCEAIERGAEVDSERVARLAAEAIENLHAWLSSTD